MEINFICRKGTEHFATPILDCSDQSNKSILKIKRSILNSKTKALISAFFSKNIWVEWAGHYAIDISKIKRKNQNLIIRLHRYELFNKKYMDRIKWRNVDKLIFVNPELEKYFLNNINPNVNTITIPNAIEVNKFDYHKPSDENSLLAYSQSFNPIKSYHKLITTFSKLIKINPNFNLTIAAKYPIRENHIENYNECKKLIEKNRLSQNITLHIIKNDSEIISLLKNNNAIISYSDVESFHYSFAEGLLSGLEGFCNGWRELNPQCFWNNWWYPNEKEFITALLDWGKSSIDARIKKSLKNKSYIIDNFSAEKISQLYLNLFKETV